jgi:hypothetical protein
VHQLLRPKRVSVTGFQPFVPGCTLCYCDLMHCYDGGLLVVREFDEKLLITQTLEENFGLKISIYCNKIS